MHAVLTRCHLKAAARVDMRTAEPNCRCEHERPGGVDNGRVDHDHQSVHEVQAQEHAAALPLESAPGAGIPREP
jgi:hypothetical protein